MCLCYVMKNKIIYPCKIPCEMYICIFIAKRFLFFFLFFDSSSVITSQFVSVFGLFYQPQLAHRNLKIIIHNCLEKLNMYGIS